ncbi:MAG: exodeoxyribonuclease VII small subunit [Bacteroidia bacterium]|nr:exodeoxyribonuclease VII small subunit [Bacteroidia bacterium]
MGKQKNTGIEASLQRLQDIVQKLDAEETPLEDSMKLYEEGILIVESCVKDLSEARTRVKELRKRADGVFELLDFEAE